MKESPRPPRTFLEFLLTEPRLVPVSEKAAGCGGHGKCRPGSAPAVAPTPQVQPMPPPAQARGCKRRSPRRHLFAPPRGRGPSQTPPSRATDSSISPGSPLSLAAGTVQRKAFLAILAANHGLPFAPGSCLEKFVNAVNGLMQGCRGRSPRRNKLLISPFPGGEGGWGDGGKKVN